jgi:hypothetical protein
MRFIAKQKNPLDSTPLRLLRIAGFSFAFNISVHDAAVIVCLAEANVPASGHYSRKTTAASLYLQRYGI